MPANRKLIRIIGASLLVVASIALSELLTTCLLPRNQPFDERKLCTLHYVPSGLSRQNLVANQTMYAIDSEGRTRTDSVRYRINSHGYRGDEWAIDTAAVRIVILGGSHVFDIGAYDGAQADPWPLLLEKELRKKGARVQVFNMGVPGASTPEIVARSLYDVPSLSPHFVILNSTWNDLKWIANFSHSLSLFSPGAMMPNPFIEKVTVLDDVLGWSVVYRKLRDAYYRHRYNFGTTTGPVENLARTSSTLAKEQELRGLRQYELNLKAFVHIVRSIGATPMLAIEERLVHPNNTEQEKKRIRYDFIGPNITHEHLAALFAACDSVILQVSRQLNVEVIDANGSLQSNADAYFTDHIHTTREGSKALASAYAEALSPVTKPATAQAKDVKSFR